MTIKKIIQRFKNKKKELMIKDMRDQYKEIIQSIDGKTSRELVSLMKQQEEELLNITLYLQRNPDDSLAKEHLKLCKALISIIKNKFIKIFQKC